MAAPFAPSADQRDKLASMIPLGRWFAGILAQVGSALVQCILYTDTARSVARREVMGMTREQVRLTKLASCAG